MLLDCFCPKWHLQNFTYCDPKKLVQLGIRVLIVDVDNTLVAHDEPEPDKAVFDFLKAMKEAGIVCVIASNNKRSRVEPFAEKLGLPFYSFSTKPLKRTYRKILREYEITPGELACIGDQLLTDILGGNRIKAYTILTEPLYTHDIGFTKINRGIERWIKKSLIRQGKMEKL